MPTPIPGGTIGRTDQGVDISAAPGASIVDPVPGISKAVGIIQNWYAGQPFEWFKTLTGPLKGKYWYQAEQITNLTPVGSEVSQGQQISRYAKSGSATEFGYATASGQTEAAATTGYTEGEQTTAGKSFKSQVVNAASNRRSPISTTSSAVPSYVPKNYVSWVRQAASGSGLPTSVVAAQIQDESGFNPNATSSTGAEGIAQIEPGTWKGLGIKGTPYQTGPALQGYSALMSSLLKQYNGNIRDALAAYNAGSGNLAAGYGYADNILSKAGMSYGSKASTSTPITRPGGTPAGASSGASVNDLFASYEAEVDMPRQAPSSATGLTAPVTWWWQSFTNTWDNEQSGGSSGS